MLDGENQEQKFFDSLIFFGITIISALQVPNTRLSNFSHAT